MLTVGRFIVLVFCCWCGFGWPPTLAQTIPADWALIPSPTPHQDSNWLVTDFLENGDLLYKSLFHIDFESNGTAWIASSEGLHRYDGYRWNFYTEKDGLPSRLIRCVLVTHDDVLWAATDRGVGVFDGSTFKTYTSELNVAGPSVRRMCEEKDGTIWFCCDPWPDATLPGGLTKKKNDEWVTYRVEDGLPSKHVLNFFRDSQDRLYALTNKGLGVFDNGNWTQPLKEAGIPGYDSVMWDVAETRDGEIIVTADDAQFVYRNREWTRSANPFAPYSNNSPSIRLCATRDGGVFTFQKVDSDRTAFQERTGSEYQPRSYQLTTLPGNVEYVTEAPDGSLWAVGFNTLLQWKRTNAEWTAFDLPTPRLCDGNGRVWFSGERTLVKDGDRWYRIDGFQGDLILDSNKNVWGRSKNRIYRWLESHTQIYEEADHGLRDVVGVQVDPTGKMWAYGADAEGKTQAVYFENGRWRNRRLGPVSESIIQGSQPDRRSGIWLLTQPKNEAGYRFYHVTTKDAPHSFDGPADSVESLNGFVIDPKGDLWLYGKNGLAFYDLYVRTPSWMHFSGLQDREVFAAFCQEKKQWFGMRWKEKQQGEIAALTENRGGWIYYSTNAHRFGRMAENGNIYMGGKGELFLIPPYWNHAPYVISFPTLDVVENVVSEGENALWLGTENTVLQYDPIQAPPETIVVNSVEEILEGESLQVYLRGIDYFAPMRQRSSYRFSWRINQGDWNSFQTLPQDGLPLAGLAPGRYEIEVRAQDVNFNVDPTPEKLFLYVHPKSIQQTWWFRVLAITTFILIFFLVVYVLWARRKLRHYTDNLEIMVELRTGALKESEEKLRFQSAVLENISDWVTATDLDYRITYVSPSVKNVLGYEPGDLIGKTTIEAYGRPEPLTSSREEMMRGIKRGNWQGEAINTTRKGQKIILSIHIGTLYDEEGNPTGTVSVARDITALKQLEEQLQQTQKIKAIGQLAGGISHDFNNLLTGIIGNLNIAMMRGHERIRPFLKNAEEAANRAAELVKQLLAFSRKSEIELNLVCLNDVMDEVYNLARHTIDRRIDIIVQKENNLPPVLADKAQMITVLMNLCVNARDAIEDVLTGRVQADRAAESFAILIRTKSLTIKNEYCRNHPQAKPGRVVCISVTDNGMGMPQETQLHVFEPFYTTKEVDKGTGLGLSSVYGTITQHNGWIELYSMEGVGTSFHIYLPISKLHSQKTAIVSKSPIHGGQETILLVDDEDLIRNLGSAVLEPMGYKVLMAKDGEEAIDIVRENYRSIDLVLLDVSMPKHSGWEVLRIMQSIHSHIKVVMCSGYSRLETSDPAFQSLPHLPKPYHPDKLIEIVRDVLDR